MPPARAQTKEAISHRDVTLPDMLAIFSISIIVREPSFWDQPAASVDSMLVQPPIRRHGYLAACSPNGIEQQLSFFGGMGCQSLTAP